MAERSVGDAVAVAILAPLAARSARAERLAREEEDALAKVPVLPRPSPPVEPPQERFDPDRFWPTLWLIPVFLIFVGYWISDKTVFESGFPWVPMLLVPVLLAVLNGYWPVLRTMQARERHRSELSWYEAEVAAAVEREAEREEIRARFARRASAGEEGIEQ